MEFKDTNVGFSLKGKNKPLINNNRGVRNGCFQAAAAKLKSIKTVRNHGQGNASRLLSSTF